MSDAEDPNVDLPADPEPAASAEPEPGAVPEVDVDAAPGTLPVAAPEAAASAPDRRSTLEPRIQEDAGPHAAAPKEDTARLDALAEKISAAGPLDARELLEEEPDEIVVRVLAREAPAFADEILWHFDDARRAKLLAAASPELRDQWVENHTFAEDTIGRMMEPPAAMFGPDMTVRDVIVALRPIVARAFITYVWITGDAQKLVGVVAFRELVFARPDQTLGELMIKDPFALDPATPVTDAMREVVKRHYPVYPVCDPQSGRLLGTVRGQTLFEQQAIDISAQPGSMVGVEKEERLATPWQRSLRFRHPWLQLNLLTAFAAAAVVGMFESTLDRLVVLAVFLPVLAGQSGNTGCQALAVSLRAMTLGEIQPGQSFKIVAKEALLGFANGTLVGITAGLGMFAYATFGGRSDGLLLAGVVFGAMIGSCTVSGIAGAIVPMTLKRLGADPATASSIFLTTATDVVSMGLFLSLATVFVL